MRDPSRLPKNVETRCPQWQAALASLRRGRYLERGATKLTDKGRARIREVLFQHKGELPNPSPTGSYMPFRIHVAPIGSGNKVIEDETYWSFVSKHMRKTLGLEMEAASLGELAHAQRDLKLDALVMKGIMDFADHGRDDHFKEFAARASAECLIAFLRENVEPRIVPDIDDILTDGHVDLPAKFPPSALLNAHHEVAPFRDAGREDILADLDLWCDEGPAVAVRLLYAKGGAGKTRLGVEWARRRRDEARWDAGFLPEVLPDDWFTRLLERGRSIVVIMDYAESRASLRDGLLRIVRYQQQNEGARTRVRLLLLARNDGDWWHSLRRQDTALAALLDATPPRELSALAGAEADRLAVVRQAAAEFAKKRGKPEPNVDKLELHDDRFERVLYLHMAALAAVERLPKRADAGELLDAVLDHEERFWSMRGRLEGVILDEQRSLARQLVAAATLRGGLEASDIGALLGRLLGRPPQLEERAVVRLLAAVYLSSSSGPSIDSSEIGSARQRLLLPPLEPDLLGEAMVARVAAPSLASDIVAPDWITRVFPIETTTEAVRSGFLALGRVSAQRPALVRNWLRDLLTGRQSEPLHVLARIHAAFDAALALTQTRGGPDTQLGALMADTLETLYPTTRDQSTQPRPSDPHFDDLARAILDRLPEHTLSLRELGAWASKVCLPVARGTDRARGLRRVCVYLGELGQHGGALAAAREEVDIYRELSSAEPARYLTDLAISLNSLAVSLGNLEQREPALELEREAVAILRDVVTTQPVPGIFYLASTLKNLSELLGNMEQRESAFKAACEAYCIYRDIVKANPGRFMHNFAESLNAVSMQAGDLGQPELALAAMEEATDIYRELADATPDAFLPGLVRSLNNLGSTLHELRRDEQALKVMTEAANVHRKLAKARPRAFAPFLALCLTNMSCVLGALRRHRAAIDVASEAVSIVRGLANSHGHTFLPQLATSLNNLGNHCRDARRLNAAIEATHEAVEILRDLAKANPRAFLPNLATSLNNLANFLTEDGQPDKALSTAHEAVEIHRDLVREEPDAFLGDLSASLSTLRNVLRDLDQGVAAVEAAREAVDISRGLATAHPSKFLPDLATGVSNLSALLAVYGQYTAAIEFAREALEIKRRLAEEQADTFLPDVAAGLNNLSAMLYVGGNPDDAIKTQGEALRIYRELALTRPAILQYVAATLEQRGELLGVLKEPQLALDSLREAVSIYRELAKTYSEAVSDLADCLKKLSALLAQLGQHDAADEATKEAATLGDISVGAKPAKRLRRTSSSSTTSRSDRSPPDE